MTTRLGLISDIHANPAPVKEAMSIFEQHNVDLILCGGDIAGYGENLDETLELLIKYRCISVLGNHEIWYLEKNENNTSLYEEYIKSLSLTFHEDIEGKSVYMVHAQPPDSYMGGIRLLDQFGVINNEQKDLWEYELKHFKHDVLIVGHTHQVFAEKLSGTLVINPGSTTYNHSCAILNLPELTVEFFALSGKEIKKSWNWGEQLKNERK